MQIILIHPNYHSGGAEIAGNWPPAWVAYIAGPLKAAGYTDIRFIDAMTNDISEEDLREILRKEKPDVVGATAITPSIYKAERLLQIAKEEHPNAVTVLGGIHATFMYQQVLTEAPWIDAIVRGEGESIMLNVVRSVEKGKPGAKNARTSRASPTTRKARSQRPRRSRQSPIWMRLTRIGACSNGRSISTSRRERASLFRTWPAAVPSPAASARNGNSGGTIVFAIRRRWSTKSRRSSATIRWASSSSPTKSRPSTARNSSSSARS